MIGIPMEAGADLAAVPCSTSHRYFDEVRAETGVALLDMVASTVTAVGKSASVGINATPATLE